MIERVEWGVEQPQQQQERCDKLHETQGVYPDALGGLALHFGVLAPEKSVHGVREGNGKVLARVDNTARMQGNETSEAVRHVEKLLVCVVGGCAGPVTLLWSGWREQR